MGSSYRSDLKSGRMPEWELKLRMAVKEIGEVIQMVYENIGDDGQFDNAADDGGLIERLSISKQFILDELPETKK